MGRAYSLYIQNASHFVYTSDARKEGRSPSLTPPKTASLFVLKLSLNYFTKEYKNE